MFFNVCLITYVLNTDKSLNIMLGQGLSNLATVESVGNETIPMPDFNLTNLGWSPSIGDF